jgi:hypothetical protein
MFHDCDRYRLSNLSPFSNKISQSLRLDGLARSKTDMESTKLSSLFGDATLCLVIMQYIPERVVSYHHDLMFVKIMAKFA